MASESLEARFALTLDSNLDGVAKVSATALEGLRDKIQADTGALRGMQNALKNLQAGSTVNIATFRQLKDRIAAARESIAASTNTYLASGGSFTALQRKSQGLSLDLGQLRDVIAGAGGPFAALIQRGQGLRALFAGGALSGGVLAVAAAIAAVSAAAMLGAAALLRYGLAAAGARRDELLHLEGLTKLRNYYGIAAGKATDLQAAIDKASEASATGRGAISGYAEQLYRAGFRGENLTQTLEAMGIVAATQGEAQASHFMAMASGARFAGQGVKRLADDVKARLGGIAERQLLSLGNQAEKLKENFGLLFKDVKLEGFLRALKTITDLFSQNTASGRALHAIITTLFEPLGRAMAYLEPIAKRFFQGMVIGSLVLGIMLLRLRNWFIKTFGDSEILKSIDLQRAALYAGITAVVIFAAGVTAAALAVGALAGALGAVGYFVYATGKGLIQIANYAKGLASKFFEVGVAITSGIWDGMTAGWNKITGGIRNLVGSIKSAFTGALESHSPSRLFYRASLTVPQGIEAAFRDGQSGVQRAARELAPTPDMGGAPAGGGGLALGGNVTVTVGEVTIQTQATDAKGIALHFRSELLRTLRDINTQLGSAA